MKWFSVLALGFLSACSGGTDDGDGDDSATNTTGPVSCDSMPLDSATLNAAHTFYYDLDTASEVGMNDDWDISLSQWNFYAGDGVKAIVAEDTNIDDDCSLPPEEDYKRAANVMADWYDYVNYEVLAKPNVYFVRTTDGAVHRLQFISYDVTDIDNHMVSFEHGEL